MDIGGNEEEGVATLTGSYVGLPNMVNVMIEWLHAAGYRKREIQTLVEEEIKLLIVKNFDTTKADLIFTEEVCHFIIKNSSNHLSLARWDCTYYC